MPLYTCDVDLCERPAERSLGNCEICERHLCRDHVTERHTCPDIVNDSEAYWIAFVKRQEEELDKFLRIANSNLELLWKQASTLRGNIPCSIKLEKDAIAMGGFNLVFSVDFDDKVSWICRVRRQCVRSLPLPFQDQLLLAEAHTYRFLKSISVPVPVVHGVVPSSSRSNHLEAPYMFMDKVEGEVMNWGQLDDAKRGKVLDQLADVYIALRENPLPKIGSLCYNDVDGAEPVVGPLIDIFALDARVDGTIQTFGPFSSTEEYRSAVLEQSLRYIVDGEAWSTRTVDAYLVRRFLLDNVSSLPSSSSIDPSFTSSFYLKHMDDKGDHIFIDNKGNITAIIDWEFACTVPATYAFSAPLFLVDVDKFYSSSNDLSGDERSFARLLENKKQSYLASCVLQGRFEQRFASVTDCGLDTADFESRWLGLFQAANLVTSDTEWETWKKDIESKHKRDLAE